MNSGQWGVRPLPVILPPLRDELLSSWIGRHAAFYGVGVSRMLRHCLLDARSVRHLDLHLVSGDQQRLGEIFRCGASIIRKMTQSRNGRQTEGPIATVRPMQVCRRCVRHHQSEDITHGARLRSWMEGWRVSCPVCETRLEDARPMDLLIRVDASDPLLVRTAGRARLGEMLIDNGVRKAGRCGASLVELMRILMLPRAAGPRNRGLQTVVPRLIEVVVPGFDQYLADNHPHYRLPGTLLLAISIRVPVLAGVGAVAVRPDYWAERLLAAASREVQARLTACLRSLPDACRRVNENMAAQHSHTDYSTRLDRGILSFQSAA
jgi:TniQ